MKLNIKKEICENLNNTKNSSFIGYKQMLRTRLGTFFLGYNLKKTAKSILKNSLRTIMSMKTKKY